MAQTIKIVRSVLLAASMTLAASSWCAKASSAETNSSRTAVTTSKWSIKNILSAKDIEVTGDNDVLSDIEGASYERVLAETSLRNGDPIEAAKLLNSSIRMWKKHLKSYDERIQSARLALCEADLKRNKIGSCRATLRAFLREQLLRDQAIEKQIRKGLSRSELQEKGVESDDQFENRYKQLLKDVTLQPASAAVYRARLMFWDKKLNDAQRLTRLSSAFPDTTGGAVSKMDALLLSAQISFAHGDVTDLITIRRSLGETIENEQSVSPANDPSSANGSSSYIKERQARLKIVSGFIAGLNGKHDDAIESYRNAIELFRPADDTAHKIDDPYDTLLCRVYSAESLMGKGDAPQAYEEFNSVFETARRLVEGRAKGLLYQRMAQTSLDRMYETLIVRMSYEASPYSVQASSFLNAHSLSSGQWMPNAHSVSSVHSVLNVRSLPNEKSVSKIGDESVDRPFVENYESLAEALYHVGYQFKTSNRLLKAQQCFWMSAAVFEKYLPENKRQLSGTLYDLAESYFWNQSYDISILVFNRCAELRKEIDPLSTDYIMTLNTLGRVYLAAGDAPAAVDTIRTSLHLYLLKEEMRAKSIARFISALKKQASGKESGAAPSLVASNQRLQKVKSLPLKEELKLLSESRAQLDSETHGQIDDLWQVLADSYSGNKSYDEAAEVSKQLLEIRRSARNVKPSEVLGSLWQLAYICGVSNRLEDAEKYYSQLIDEFSDYDEGSKRNSRHLAYWYYSRGVVADSLGKEKAAARDFRKAVALFKTYLKSLKKPEDRESIERTSWMIYDLEQELKAKAKNPASRPDYLKGYETSYWSANRFPLKVYIDDTEERGFGPKLFGYMKKAVDEWAATPGMEGKFVFVDDREAADIYLERVSNYDLIPYGSAGGAVASYVRRGKKISKEIDRVHLRLFSKERDAEKLSNHALFQLYTLALHEFGHGLGLGHSPSGLDVMYWKSAMYRISSRDRSTLLKIYGFQEGRPDQ